MDTKEIDPKRLMKDAKKLILSSDQNEIAKGLKTLKKIIKNDPNNAWAFIYYGVGASKCEKHKHEALPAFESASSICPDSVEAWKGIRSCLEAKKRDKNEDNLLIKAYSNLLLIECDVTKWNAMYNDFKNYLTNVSDSLLASFLAAQLEDYTSKSFKHETACKDLSFLAFSNESLLDTNKQDVINAFQCRANFLDFMDRPDFCKKVCAYLTKLKQFEALSEFLCHTILIYGTKIYLKIQLMQYIIDIGFDNMDNVEKLIPLVGPSLKEIENVTSFPQIKLALCVVNYFEEDFTQTREHLENLSFSGDIYATLFLLKFLCKAKDYEAVVFLSMRFAKSFAELNSVKLKNEFLSCLLEALCSSNDVNFLDFGIKLSLKTLSKNGENQSILYNLCQSYLGLNDPKALFYLNKLMSLNKIDGNYLSAVMKRDFEPEIDPSAKKWLHYLLLSANNDLVDNNIKRALKTFMKIGAKDKCISEPFVVLGVDYISRGSIEQAASCFNRAFTLRPLDAEILKYYLDSIFKLEDEPKALRVIDSVWAGHFGKWHNIGEKSLLASGLIHSAKGQHERSIRSFKHLIKLYEDNTEFVEVIADEYIKLGRLGIAENYISRLVFNDPYNLHPLLLLTEIYKLDVNYSSYFNQSLKCLNLTPNESRESERDMKLILCSFVDFLQQNIKLEESSFSYISKLCENTLNRIDYIVSKDPNSITSNNEFLIALYMFIEAHFIGASKLLRQKEREDEVIELFNFCLTAICKVIQLYGSTYLSFWKLLGDILLKSSLLNCDLKVFRWLIDDKYEDKYVEISALDRISLGLKCYVTGLKLTEKNGSMRMTEFYYDLSVALIHLATHQKVDNFEYRYFCLKTALEFCLKSFVHSDGMNRGRWIYSNLLGVIVSLLGIEDNMFKEHFSKHELKMTEGLMLQNFAVHLAKTGLYSQAEDVFEQARLRVDMDYSYSWVGQLLMQVINKDIETKKMLTYNLTQIGNHPLFKWILGFYVVNNRPYFNFHGGQYTILNKSFPETECVHEINPFKLTLLAYVHELIGNISVARRLYFRVLRVAKFVDNETYQVFLENAVRLNNRCRQNCELIEQLDVEFAPNSSDSFYSLTSYHLQMPNVNKYILNKTLISLKNIFNNISSCKNAIALSLPILVTLSDVNLFKYLDSNMPFILNYILKQISTVTKKRKKEFKSFFSSLDSSTRSFYLKTIDKFLSIYNYKHLNMQCLTSGKSVVKFIKKSVGNVNLSDNFTLSSLGVEDDNLDQVDFNSSKIDETPTKCMKVMHNLRNTIFPLHLSDEERAALKRSRVLRLQSANVQHPKKSVAKFNENSYLNTMESHGCHSNCSLLLHLLQKSYNCKDYSNLIKFAYLSLNIKCNVCLANNKLLPLIGFICLETSDVKLMKKAFHLYPYNNLLQKTLLCFISKTK